MSKTHVHLLTLAAIAFGLRLGLALAMGIDRYPAAHSDQGDYVRYAENLVAGRGYVGPEPGSQGDVPTAYLPPGTPALYAATFATFGPSVAAARIVQCALGASSVVLLFLIARSLFGPTAAWIAAGMFALYPIALFYTYELLTETLYVFLVLLFTYVCVAILAPRPSWRTATLAGVLFGATVLTRPTLLFFVPFFLLWAWVTLPTWRGRAWAFAVLAIGALVVAPWTLHASRVHGQFVLVSPTAWTVLLQGNNRVVATVPVYAGYSVWYTEIPEYARKFDGLNQVQREVVARDLTKQWVAANVDKLPGLLANKARRFWSPFLRQDDPLRRLVMLASWGGVLVLFLPAFVVTLARLRRGRLAVVWLHLFILSVFLQSLLYFGLPRYRFPIEPFCIMFAALTLSWGVERWRARRPVPVAIGRVPLASSHTA